MLPSLFWLKWIIDSCFKDLSMYKVVCWNMRIPSYRCYKLCWILAINYSKLSDAMLCFIINKAPTLVIAIKFPCVIMKNWRPTGVENSFGNRMTHGIKDWRVRSWKNCEWTKAMSILVHRYVLHQLISVGKIPTLWNSYLLSACRYHLY